MRNGAAFTGIDVIKFSAPLFFGFWIGSLVTHHFGPYFPAGPGLTTFHNASGHPRSFYTVGGFVGGYLLMFCLWKGFLWYVFRSVGKPKQEAAETLGGASSSEGTTGR